jgi:LysM repeat protein
MKLIRIILMAGVMVSIILAACNLPASKSPTTIPTNAAAKPATTNATLHDIVSSTQTAMAKVASPIPTQPLPTVGTTEDAVVDVDGTVEPTVQPTGYGISVATQVPTKVPSQAPTVLVPTATPGLPTTYNLQEGEWCYCLARRFNILAGTLIGANPACATGSIPPGSVLTIPQGAAPWDGVRALVTHPASYTVRAGDTIYTIACYYGDVDPNAIIYANSLQSPFTLVAGQVLNIP